jgi:hypothetical protein
MGEELLARVETFEDIVKIATEYYKDRHDYPHKWGEFGYGDDAYVGVVACAIEDGDVKVNVSKDTEENRQKFVDEWNEIARKIGENERPWEYGWDLFDVFDNVEFHADISFSTSMWG